ncbi:MAG: peptidoglycan-binding protein [Rhodocyclaceae bacterium]|nr:peptidoglycan-binding protein [Rhodocyclaceae bacterium]
MADTQPAPQDGRKDNPFRAVGLLFAAVRTSLEGVKNPGQAPRWVRIVRVREFVDPDTGDADAIAKGVMAAMGGFGEALAQITRFTLTAYDLLLQGDAAKALVEVSADFVKTATSKEFINALEVAVGQPESASSPLAPVANVVDTIVKIADKVPEPEDLAAIGKELFGLLAVELLDLNDSKLDKTTEAHVDIAKTGKLRLIQWGFDQSFKIYHVGQNPVEISRLGSRRVWQAANAMLPARAVGKWGDAPAVEEVYSLNFGDAKAGVDVQEVNNLLEGLGYALPAVADKKVFDDKLAARLRRFQVINGLKITGALDNSTLNRLIHLDYEAKGLKRAKPFRARDLPQGFDDSKNPA